MTSHWLSRSSRFVVSVVLGLVLLAAGCGDSTSTEARVPGDTSRPVVTIPQDLSIPPFFTIPPDSTVPVPVTAGNDPWTEELAAAGLERVEPGPGVEPVCPPTDGSAERTLDFTGPFEDCLDPAKAYRSIWTTSEGVITVEMDTERAPAAANNIISLMRYGYYDQTAIQRIAPSIDIIQGGSPHTQDNGDRGPGFPIADEGGEFTDGATSSGPYTYGPGLFVLARRSIPDGSSPQFFFTSGPLAENLNPGVPGGGTYLVLGTVTEGLDVIQAIQALSDPADQFGRPTRTVIVETVEIEEVDR